MTTQIGEKLKEIREKKGMSQEEMAELLGKSRSAYARLELNTDSIRLSDLLDISKKLETPIQEFIPEMTSVNTYNQDKSKGVGVIFNYYIVNINQDQKQYHKEESDDKPLKQKIETLEEQLRHLKQILKDKEDRDGYKH